MALLPASAALAAPQHSADQDQVRTQVRITNPQLWMVFAFAQLKALVVTTIIAVPDPTVTSPIPLPPTPCSLGGGGSGGDNGTTGDPDGGKGG
jgi:hypothetical protein